MRRGRCRRELLLPLFVAAGLAALGLRQILAPLAVEALEITQKIGDAALARAVAEQHDKPLLVVDLHSRDAVPGAIDWLAERRRHG